MGEIADALRRSLTGAKSRDGKALPAPLELDPEQRRSLPSPDRQSTRVREPAQILDVLSPIDPAIVRLICRYLNLRKILGPLRYREAIDIGVAQENNPTPRLEFVLSFVTGKPFVLLSTP